ncbi:MAG: metallophosphoesterase family protein [Syntrophomonadaceae bacterium]|jgi:hypothetical protein|nr:metallophosphoesterase family protein [Syntrophomonadaceae bacterium]
MIPKLGFYKRFPEARRIGYLVVFLFTLVSFCFFPTIAWAEASTGEQIILTWSQDPATSQTITWLTPHNGANKVQYIEAAGYSGDFAAATQVETAGSQFGDSSHYRFSVVLANLESDTQYFYRVGSDEAWSEASSFKTAADTEDLSFLYLGDVQEGHAGWGSMVSEVYDENPQIKFALLGGDLTDSDNDFTEWEEFLGAASSVFSRIPMMPAIGNHDGEMFLEFFALPDNGPQGLFSSCFYSFDYGDAHFVVLDTSNVITDTVMQWLEQDLQNTTKKWKFAVFHHPPYQNFDDNKTVDDALREHWVPILEQNQVDMVFVGHQHVYMRTYPIYEGEVVADSYGIVYVMGNSGSKFYSTGQGFSYIAIEDTGSNYQIIELEDDVLTLTSRKADGDLIETYVLNKGDSPGGDEEPITLQLSKTVAAIGDSIAAFGRTLPNAWVPIKVVDEAGNIVLFDTGKADVDGNYSIDFVIPDSATGILTVIVGEESNVARQEINIGKEINLSLSKTTVIAGDSVTASGKTSPNAWVPIKIVNKAGNILLFDAGKADPEGNYSIDFIIPHNATGTLTVVVGEGSCVARQDIAAGAEISLLLSKTTVFAGDIVTAAGRTLPDAWVPIKIIDEAGNIVLFDTGKADAEGNYSIDFVIPDSISGILTVIVGEENRVASQDIYVAEEISLSLSKTTVSPGDIVTAAGRTLANAWVPIKVIDEAGNILFFDAGKTDAEGNYSIEFIIPADASGTLTVVAGEGNNVISNTITIEAEVDECFIATAAFGSKFNWPVALLRDFRDQYLLANTMGTAFVEFYYKHSPPIAEAIASNQWLKTLVKVLLAPAIAIVYIVYNPAIMVIMLVLIIGTVIYRSRLRNRPGLS